MRTAVTLLLALLIVTATGTGIGSAASVGLSMAIGGSAVAAGDSLTVGSDPVLLLNVSADGPIETVVVRVNGQTVQSDDPGTQSYSAQVTLDLETAENEVRVIAKAADGTVESATVTVTKDNRRPVVSFTSPFETERGVPENVTVTDGYVTVAGEIIDQTAIDQVVITRRNIYQFAGKEEVARRDYRIDDPGTSFSKKVFLGNQTNDLTITLTDAMGNQRVYQTIVEFNDTETPEIQLDPLPEQSNAPVIELDGTVEDNGQLDAVRLTVEGQFREQTLLSPVGPKPDEARTALDIEREVELTPGKHDVILTAIDLAGNEASVEYTVRYEKTIAPRIAFDEDTTAFSGDGGLSVRGVVEYGEITAVSVETVAAASDETVDIVQVYSGSVTDRVPVEETLAVADGRTRVVVRATDSNGNEHTASFVVNPLSGVTFVGRQTPTPTPETVTTATSQTTTTVTSTNTPNATSTATPDASAGDGGDGSASVEKKGVMQLITNLPGFGAGHALVGMFLLAFVLIRRRSTRD